MGIVQNCKVRLKPGFLMRCHIYGHRIKSAAAESLTSCGKALASVCRHLHWWLHVRSALGPRLWWPRPHHHGSPVCPCHPHWLKPSQQRLRMLALLETRRQRAWAGWHSSNLPGGQNTSLQQVAGTVDQPERRVQGRPRPTEETGTGTPKLPKCSPEQDWRCRDIFVSLWNIRTDQTPDLTRWTLAAMYFVSTWLINWLLYVQQTITIISGLTEKQDKNTYIIRPFAVDWA